MLTAMTLPGRRDQLHDWALAIGLTLFAWLQLWLVPLLMRDPGGRMRVPPPDAVLSIRFAEPTFVSYALAALVFMPLAFRRSFSLPVLGVTVLFAGVYDLVPNPPLLTIVAPLIALYTVGTLMPRRVLVRATLISVAFALFIALPRVPDARLIAEAVRTAAMYALAAAMGDSTRNRRAYVAEMEHRAAEAERTREEEALRRVEEERLRIARELHDVTAHSLSIIAVQAGAAERVMDRDPEAVKQALATIRATSKASLDELRWILGVLRGSEDGAPLTPAGSLSRLAELAASVEAAGVRVDLRAEELGELSAFVEVSAYRIVQEALTNVVRHAHATTATVRIWRSQDSLGMEIVDDGTAVVSAAEDGHGIAGMRERILALGGSFSAEPRPGGGFRVAAFIPLGGGVR